MTDWMAFLLMLTLIFIGWQITTAIRELSDSKEGDNK